MRPSSSFLWRSNTSLLINLILVTSTLAAVHDNVQKRATTLTYTLARRYSGSNFFDDFIFHNQADDNQGFVTYGDKNYAQRNGLIGFEGDYAVLKVDSTTNLGQGRNYYFQNGDASYKNINGVGRKSVRITGDYASNHGLVIADIGQMPSSICGTRPSFVTRALGPFASDGQIDIVHGANVQGGAFMSLHTTGQSDIIGNADSFAGTIANYDCQFGPDPAFPNYLGCQITASDPASYAVYTGGVWAMQWTSERIRIWYWPYGSVPSDVTNGTPNPSDRWGTPRSSFAPPERVLIDQNFFNQHIVFDTSFCGRLADATWASSGCAARTGYSGCADYVANSNSAFANAKWKIKYVKVFDEQVVSTTTTTTGISPSTTPLTTTSEFTTTSELTTAPPSPSCLSGAGSTCQGASCSDDSNCCNGAYCMSVYSMASTCMQTASYCSTTTSGISTSESTTTTTTSSESTRTSESITTTSETTTASSESTTTTSESTTITSESASTSESITTSSGSSTDVIIGPISTSETTTPSESATTSESTTTSETTTSQSTTTPEFTTSTSELTSTTTSFQYTMNPDSTTSSQSESASESTSNTSSVSVTSTSIRYTVNPDSTTSKSGTNTLTSTLTSISSTPDGNTIAPYPNPTSVSSSSPSTATSTPTLAWSRWVVTSGPPENHGPWTGQTSTQAYDDGHGSLLSSMHPTSISTCGNESHESGAPTISSVKPSTTVGAWKEWGTGSGVKPPGDTQPTSSITAQGQVSWNPSKHTDVSVAFTAPHSSTTPSTIKTYVGTASSFHLSTVTMAILGIIGGALLLL